MKVLSKVQILILAFMPIIVVSQKPSSNLIFGAEQDANGFTLDRKSTSVFQNAPKQYRGNSRGQGQWLWSTWPWNRKPQAPPAEKVAESEIPAMYQKITSKCRDTQTEFKGKCFAVLQQLPCGDGQWLIEDPETSMGKCVENKCADYPNTGRYKDQCVTIRSEEVCPKGMKTYIYKSGIVDCDCKEGYIFNRDDGNCYEAYRQGPCKKGEYFGFSSSADKPSCFKNFCQIDGYFCNGDDSSCQYRQNTFWNKISRRNNNPKIIPTNCLKFGAPCGTNNSGIFTIDLETIRPVCQSHEKILKSSGDISTRIIGNVPSLKCAPGSRKDILGNCREPTVIEFS